MGQRQLEGRRHVVGVHVVERGQPPLGQAHAASVGEVLEHAQVEVPGRVDGHPPRPHDVARVQHGGREAVHPGAPQQVRLDLRLLDAVRAVRPARRALERGHELGGAVHPDGAAVQQVLHAPLEGLDELATALGRETDEVDDRVGLELGDGGAEASVALGRLAVEVDGLHELPGARVPVGLPLPTAHGDDLVPLGHEPGNEVGADVSGGADDDGAHAARSLHRSLRGGRRGLPDGGAARGAGGDGGGQGSGQGSGREGGRRGDPILRRPEGGRTGPGDRRPRRARSARRPRTTA